MAAQADEETVTTISMNFRLWPNCDSRFWQTFQSESVAGLRLEALAIFSAIRIKGSRAGVL